MPVVAFAAALHFVQPGPPGTFGTPCQTCPAGMWCPVSSPPQAGSRQDTSAPQPCPDNMTSPPGSFSESQCVCLAGYGGAQCTRCSEGSYSVGGTRGDCQSCPEGQTSMAGASSDTDCGCLPGLGGANCTQCPRGFYSANGACTACPLGFTSDVAATGLEQCCECHPWVGWSACYATVSTDMVCFASLHV